MPLWKKGDTTAYNAWRREYRRKRIEQGLCHRCGRPLFEDSNRVQCENCTELIIQQNRLRRELWR